MGVPVEQFVKALIQVGLATTDDLKTFWGALPAEGRPTDGEGLAKLLIEKGKLSSFQAKHLLAGRGAGLIFGEYILVEQVGEGGMGKVYKAQHRRMFRTVALKVISPAAMKDEATVRRFEREVHAAARLEHPNVVAAYDAGQAGTTHYLVMQFVDGGDLSELIKKKGVLPVETAVNYVVQAARGLGYAHAEGIVHRDIKPANLLVDKKGIVKILDMGLARIEGGDGLTGTEQVMGTVDYMSPEQASDTKSADARSDVYSLGCTLWFLLTGKKLYDGSTMIARLMAHREAPPPSLLKECDDVPWGLEQAFHKMIAKRPADRFQSMDEVIAALEPYAGGVQGGSPSGIGSSAISAMGMGSSIGMGSRDAELSVFLKGIAPQPGSSSHVTAKPKSDSRISRTQAVASSLSDTDATATRSKSSASLSATSAKPSAKAPRRPLSPAVLLGGALTTAATILVIVWLMSRGPEAPATGEIAASNAVAAITPVKTPVADAPGSRGAVVAPPPKIKKAPTTPYDFLTSPDFEWTEPENLGPVVNGPTSDLNPCLSTDGLTLLFDSDRAGKIGRRDLWQCRRASLDAPWSAPENLGPLLNFEGRSSMAPSLSADGLTLYYSCDGFYDGHGAHDIGIATRKSTNDAWGEPKPLSSLINSSGGEESPELSFDGLRLIYVSWSQGGFGRSDLWEVVRKDLNATFRFAGPMKPPVNSPNDDRAATLSSDNCVILFQMARTGGIGANDIWMCTRETPNHPWTAPVPLPRPVNTTSNEEGPYLSPDGKALYFSSNRGPGGNTDLWMSRLVSKADLFPPGEGELALKLMETGYEWSPPENLGPNVNDNSTDRSPSLTADELTLVFSSNRLMGTNDLFEARRKRIGEPFGPAELIQAVASTTSTKANPSITSDGLAVVYSATNERTTVEAHDLYLIRREKRESPWVGPAVHLGADLNSDTTDTSPTLSPDGLTLVFASNRVGGQGKRDLFVARRSSTAAPFGAAESLGLAVNTSLEEDHPRFLADGKTIVFDREGSIFLAFRSVHGTMVVRQLPQPAPKCYHPWVSPDGERIYFCAPSVDGNGFGGDDLWISHRVAKK